MRNEYPRPQFERKDWINLNGEWTCKIGRRPPFTSRQPESPENIASKGFAQKITVPYAPETELSGVGEKEIITKVYYHRTIKVPASWIGKRILLNFGAVFYHAEIWIDGDMVDFHDGGSSSFSVDLTDAIRDTEEHDLVVLATSMLADGSIPSGKQSSFMKSYACYYQRTTGIWQTVWMEAVGKGALSSVRTVWNDAQKTILFTPEYHEVLQGAELRIVLLDGGREIGRTTVPEVQGIPVMMKVEEPHLWSTDDPHLYDIRYEVISDGEVVDTVASYIGLRTVTIEDNEFYLNGKKLYQRLVLDQGFYPDGNWTAPTDEDLKNDIELSMKAGFNGARLHQKVFEERFFYHADRLGYLLWAESPSWGLDYNDGGLPARNFLSEWKSLVRRDVNHPSIICWTPLNETYLFENAQAHRRLHRDAYEICKVIDPSRPVNDASGYIHFITDVWTSHSYVQDPKKFLEQMRLHEGKPFRNFPDQEVEYDGQPYIVDEFGGIKWDPETQKDAALGNAQNLSSWGYGNAPRSEEEYYERLEALVDVIIGLDHVSGYCFTQLTDVEQEKNGIYFYSRKEKFDMDRIRRIFSKVPDRYI